MTPLETLDAFRKYIDCHMVQVTQASLWSCLDGFERELHKAANNKQEDPRQMRLFD